LHSAITPLIRFLSRTVISLFVIAIILAGGRFFLGEMNALRASRVDLLTLTEAQRKIAASQREQSARADDLAKQAREATLVQVDERIRRARATLRENQGEPEVSLLGLSIGGSDQALRTITDHYRKTLQADFAAQEIAYLQKLRVYLVALSGRSAVVSQYNRSVIDLNAARALLLQRQRERDQLAPAFARRYLSVFYGAELEMAQEQVKQAKNQYDSALKNFQAQRKALALFDTLAQRPGFTLDTQAIEKLTHDTAERLASARHAVATNWVARFASPVVVVLPLAVAVLLSSFVAHLVVKLMFYYLLAPLASQRKPICLAPAPVQQNAVERQRTAKSAVSQDVHLTSDETLLILPEYLQSASTALVKDTKWLLDWSCPWTSLVSGMYMLTRVRTTRHDDDNDDEVVISSASDAASEIALITISRGDALVFQPRGLVGVIYATSTPLRITRRWRLFSAHAWLTLQLRYLIFHGPVTLIVQGSRGVRVESSGRGRVISQSATLGFSAHLHYATVRSETFWPYYQNRTSLLQDKFDGENGVYIYDETPQSGKAGGFFARGLEGLADAVLKVFGI